MGILLITPYQIDTTVWSQMSNEVLARYSACVRSVADELEIAVIDLCSPGTLIDFSDLDDGLRFNEIGHMKIFEYVKIAIKILFVKQRL